jgi:hypothetical protein
MYLFNSFNILLTRKAHVLVSLQVGTPLCVPTKEFIDIGMALSIEINHKAKGSTIGYEGIFYEVVSCCKISLID